MAGNQFGASSLPCIVIGMSKYPFDLITVRSGMNGHFNIPGKVQIAKKAARLPLLTGVHHISAEPEREVSRKWLQASLLLFQAVEKLGGKNNWHHTSCTVISRIITKVT